MKIKRFSFWYRLVDYVRLRTGNELVLEIDPYHQLGFKYSLKKCNMGVPSCILLETDSREEVKIWLDLRGYKCKELLNDETTGIYCIVLSND